MIKDFAFIRPPTMKDLPLLEKLAADDGHGFLPPTWVVEKQGELSGYFAVMPSVLAWLSTKRVTARDSFHLINTVENMLLGPQTPLLNWPIPKDSPFFENMEPLGYADAGPYNIFIRKPTI